MAYKINPFTGNLDYYRKNDELDARYVKKAGDTMTGKLTITPASGGDSLEVTKDIRVKEGQRVILNNS